MHGYCSDCEYWKGTTGTKGPETAECYQIRPDKITHKAFIKGDPQAVLITRADFGCEEHLTHHTRSGIGSVQAGMP
jgi:hypothetical protein